MLSVEVGVEVKNTSEDRNDGVSLSSAASDAIVPETNTKKTKKNRVRVATSVVFRDGSEKGEDTQTERARDHLHTGAADEPRHPSRTRSVEEEKEDAMSLLERQCQGCESKKDSNVAKQRKGRGGGGEVR